MEPGASAVRTGVCYLTVSVASGTTAALARVVLRMTDDVESGGPIELQALGVDDACQAVRAWIEGLTR